MFLFSETYFFSHKAVSAYGGKVRGLAGHDLELIIMDGCPGQTPTRLGGLWSTIDEVYPSG
jgi:hypothetical protein